MFNVLKKSMTSLASRLMGTVGLMAISAGIANAEATNDAQAENNASLTNGSPDIEMATSQLDNRNKIAFVQTFANVMHELDEGQGKIGWANAGWIDGRSGTNTNKAVGNLNRAFGSITTSNALTAFPEVQKMISDSPELSQALLTHFEGKAVSHHSAVKAGVNALKSMLQASAGQAPALATEKNAATADAELLPTTPTGTHMMDNGDTYTPTSFLIPQLGFPIAKSSAEPEQNPGLLPTLKETTHTVATKSGMSSDSAKSSDVPVIGRDFSAADLYNGSYDTGLDNDGWNFSLGGGSNPFVDRRDSKVGTVNTLELEADYFGEDYTFQSKLGFNNIDGSITSESGIDLDTSFSAKNDKNWFVGAFYDTRGTVDGGHLPFAPGMKTTGFHQGNLGPVAIGTGMDSVAGVNLGKRIDLNSGGTLDLYVEGGVKVGDLSNNGDVFNRLSGNDDFDYFVGAGFELEQTNGTDCHFSLVGHARYVFGGDDRVENGTRIVNGFEDVTTTVRETVPFDLSQPIPAGFDPANFFQSGFGGQGEALFSLFRDVTTTTQVPTQTEESFQNRERADSGLIASLVGTQTNKFTTNGGKDGTWTGQAYGYYNRGDFGAGAQGQVELDLTDKFGVYAGTGLHYLNQDLTDSGLYGTVDAGVSYDFTDNAKATLGARYIHGFDNVESEGQVAAGVKFTF